jgi:hypothetical protein
MELIVIAFSSSFSVDKADSVFPIWGFKNKPIPQPHFEF